MQKKFNIFYILKFFKILYNILSFEMWNLIINEIIFFQIKFNEIRAI